jgi:nicotinamidase/pyrazinamidase
MATYDPSTALLVIDMQNDFADPRGGLAVPGAEEVIGVVNDEVTAACQAGSPVVYTQDWHPESTPHFSTAGGVWPVHCVRETWGAELHPDLQVEGPVIRKGTEGEDGYSGFSVRDPVSGEESSTQLGALLDGKGVRRVVVVGLAGDVCVKETALDARRRGYDVVVPLRATRSVNMQEGDEERAVAEMEAAGVVVER